MGLAKIGYRMCWHLKKRGTVAVVLHSHLPYVRHPESESVLEELWLYEAITETYIPFLRVCTQLLEEGVRFRYTVSITPPLAHMLADELLQSRYQRHLEKLLELVDKEVERTRWQPDYHDAALHYQRELGDVYAFWQHWNGNLLNAYRSLQQAGCIEIIGSAATHGFLPLLQPNPASVRAQVLIGAQAYERAFGSTPRGFWLPECGFYPEVSQYLAQAGVRYSILDSHGVMHGSPRPRYAVYAPVYTPEAVAFFGRDWESSTQVWSASEGYPGDPVYRDFYRDIGFDLDWDYISSYLVAQIRGFTGIKYHAITGKTADKQVYNWRAARDRTAMHAGHFMFNRERQIEWLASIMDREPIILAPYDAELFGHWWYEGPWFLYYLAKKSFYDQNVFQLGSPGDYLTVHKRNQVTIPSPSSWGDGGYNSVWLNDSNEWIYRHLHQAANRMERLAAEFPAAQGDVKRALNQSARELLLAQSSDWPFIMRSGTMTEYAVRRVKEHVGRFTELFYQITENRINPHWLRELEHRDNIFPWLDYHIYDPEHQMQPQISWAASR